MATNLLAPVGLSFSRNFLSGANTYMSQPATILNGYGTAIMVGDPVLIASNGTIQLLTAQTNATGLFGIFAGVTAFYDTNLQATSHGLNGAYMTAAAPVSGTNIPCLVITDPYATFIVQTNATSGYTQSWTGMNCAWLAASVGNTGAGINSTGRSGAYVDGTVTGFATTNTLPLRVIGPAGVTGGPQDPANLNPWIEVRLNGSSVLSTTGI